jgi:WD40 repeat protein
METRRQTRALAHGDPVVTGVAFTPDGRHAASVARDGRLLMWALVSGRTAWTVELGRAGRDVSDFRLAVCPTGGMLAAVGSDDRLASILDVATGRRITALAGHQTDVSDATFSPDGKQLASAESGGTVRFWSSSGWNAAGSVKAHDAFIHRIAYSPNGSRLATASRDRTVRLWDSATGRPIATLRHGLVVYGLAFKPDGTRLAAACEDGTVRLWDLETFVDVAELHGHGDYVHAVTFSPDGNRLVSGSGDYSVRVWDAQPTDAGHPAGSLLRQGVPR